MTYGYFRPFFSPMQQPHEPAQVGSATLFNGCLLKGNPRESCKCVGRTHVRTQPPRPSYLGARRTRRLIRSSSWPSAKGKNYSNKRPSTSQYERISPQADFSGHETAMGKMEGKVRSREIQRPSCNECRCQEEVVRVDEGTLGREAQGESITESLQSKSKELRMDDQELFDLLSDIELDRTERKASLADPDRMARRFCAFANDLPAHERPGVLFVGARRW